MQLRLRNDSDMWHPMHVHGHTSRIGDTATGARKDTVAVLSRQTVVVELDADNPDQLMVHCHNTYHLEAGMATVLSYVRWRWPDRRCSE